MTEKARDLTPIQQAAVERTNQDVCVVAGPGSGKTRVLIERFGWLVDFHHVDPSRILGITFTEKAATEIKDRLIKRFKDTPEHRESIERAWVSTIDGFCARLLQENAIAAGIAPDFAVLDPTQAVRLERESAEECLDELFAERSDDMRRLLESLDLSTDDSNGRKPDLAKSIIDVYESMRISGLDELPEAQPCADVWDEADRLAQEILDDPPAGKSHTAMLREWATEFLQLPRSPVELKHFEIAGGMKAYLNRIGQGRAHAAAEALKNRILPALQSQFMEICNSDLLHLLREAVTRLDRNFRRKKRDQSALDFADLEQDAIRLLESDFFIRQATQARFDQILMDELQDTNRLQWRLLDLIRTPDAFFAVGDVNQSIYGFRHADPEVFLEYRNRLEASGGIIDDLRENHRSRQTILDAVSLVLDGQPGIEPRPLIAAKTFQDVAGPTVERLFGETPEIEASLIGDRIRRLVAEGECDYENVAILVRSLNSLDAITAALDDFDIPYITSGGRTFLEAREIRDLLALLAALVNPLDEIALVGVLRSPFVNLGDEELFHLGRAGRQQVFEERFGHLRKRAGFLSPDRLLISAFDQSHLTSRARANIDKLLSWLRREHRARPRPLAEMLDDLEMLRETKSEAEAPPPEAGNVVRLMTIHSAKGLEFQVVFLSAMQKGSDNSTPVLAFSKTSGLGAKWRHPGKGNSQPDPTYAALNEDRKRREAEEDNRLLYVAMTRAEQRLYLTYSGPSRGWQKLVEPAIGAEFTASTPIPAPERSGNYETNPTQIVQTPVLSGQHDSTAAVTSVAIFAECPRKYFLSKYIGIEPEPDDWGTGAMSLGSEVHKILAGGTSRSLEAQELAAKFRKPERTTRMEHEFDFLYAIEDIVLRGQIDLWYEQDGELVVVDYKTDKEELPEAHAFQMRIYALALEQYLGRLPDRAMLFYLRTGREAEISISLNDLNSAKNIVRELINSHQTMQFSLREGDHCRRCAFYQGMCPAGKN